MHANSKLLEKLYTCLGQKDPDGMAECYHSDAEFQDIGFTLDSKKKIHAMWRLICATDLRSSFTIVAADSETGTADLIDDYTFPDTGRRVHNVIRSEFRFRDGLIIRHHDSCNALRWGIQALGPVMGVLSWLFPAKRRTKAMAKLEEFIAGERKKD